MGAVIPYILSCLFVVPLADMWGLSLSTITQIKWSNFRFGRKSVLKIGCQLMLFAVFMKIILLNYIRETIGLAILHVAYPCLKYTTESLGNDNNNSFFVTGISSDWNNVRQNSTFRLHGKIHRKIYSTTLRGCLATTIIHLLEIHATYQIQCCVSFTLDALVNLGRFR